MKGALLVTGTHSDAGKSVIVAGICRWLAREGVKVAPLKAQNMALNSFVTREGAEIGRAQVAQAAAARVEPEVAMNPVLLKPSAEKRTQVIVRGKPWVMASASSYQEMKGELLPVVLESLEDLRHRFEVVVCEGAGSPAEINLRDGDIANMGLARAANLPVVVVGDIDRGGLFASLYGTLALLDEEDRALIRGFIVNKFRGDATVLAPGLARMSELTGRPFLGTLPYVRGLGLDGEDSLALDAPRDLLAPRGRDVLRVAVVRLPRISNFTDFDALAERARRALPTLGICGGYQMLGESIRDGVESGERGVSGLGLLPVETVFAEEKVLARPEGRAPMFEDVAISGYEIRHGRVRRLGGEPLFTTNVSAEGCRVGTTFGTSWHGVFETDGFRRAFLSWVSELRGLDWATGDEPFAARREAQLDKLGDLVAENVDREALLRLIEGGPPLISYQQDTFDGTPGAKASPTANGEAVPNASLVGWSMPGGGGQGKAGG